jgi:hypothetical protein
VDDRVESLHDRSAASFESSPTVASDNRALANAEQEWRAAIAERDQRIRAMEQAYGEAIKERALVAALSEKPLVAGGLVQLLKLWRDELDVVVEGTEHEVRTRDGRPLEEAIEDWLEKPDYAHFRPATARGGTSVPGQGRTSSAPTTNGRPMTLGEAVVTQWRDQISRQGEGIAPPVGLRPRPFR